MRSTSALFVVFVALSVRIGWADEPGAAAATEQQPTASAAPADVGDRGATPAATGEKWRYKRHNGQWWYWLPSNKWVYWNDGRWVDYDAQSYAQSNASSARRSYSRSPGTQWGPWGPIYYDRWGNPKYPYSRRKTGLKQLGPVPALGGVRSLPGWGGER